MRARQFDAEDSELLQLFANQAALAIENARLLQSETDQARRLEVLYDNAKMLTMSLELGEVLDAMIEAAARITQATFCACYLVDEQQGDLCYAAGRGARPEVFTGLRLAFGEGLVGVSVAEDRPLLVPDIRLDARAARSDLDEAEGLRAVIYAPLRHRGRVIGALAAGRPEPNSFSDEHLRLLSAFADHAASAIANARLHDRTEEDLRHLNSLRAVVESISSELDLTSLLDKVVVHAVELLDAHGGTVSLVNPQTGLARLKSVYGLSAFFVDFEMPAGTGLVGRVLEQRGPVVVDRYAELPQPLDHREPGRPRGRRRGADLAAGHAGRRLRDLLARRRAALHRRRRRDAQHLRQARRDRDRERAPLRAEPAGGRDRGAQPARARDPRHARAGADRHHPAARDRRHGRPARARPGGRSPRRSSTRARTCSRRAGRSSTCAPRRSRGARCRRRSTS